MQKRGNSCDKIGFILIVSAIISQRASPKCTNAGGSYGLSPVEVLYSRKLDLRTKKSLLTMRLYCYQGTDWTGLDTQGLAAPLLRLTIPDRLAMGHDRDAWGRPSWRPS